MVQKWSQITKNLIFELETWDSYQTSFFIMNEGIWTQNCRMCTLRCLIKVQKGPKRVQNGSKRSKNQFFELETWDSYQKCILMIDKRIWNQNCLKCNLRCPKRGSKWVQNGSKMVQKSIFWARDLRFTPDVYFLIDESI